MDIYFKKDRENSRKMMKDLEQGDNMRIFPEDIWNLSEKDIIHDIHFGMVDVALERLAVIVPIVAEQYGSRFVINIGEIYDSAIVSGAITEKGYSLLNEEDK